MRIWKVVVKGLTLVSNFCHSSFGGSGCLATVPPRECFQWLLESGDQVTVICAV